MKRTGYRTLFIVILILVSMSVGAVANSQIEKIQAFIRSDYQVKINGIASNIGPVLVYESKSYLPVDYVAKAVGSNVYWDANTKTIHINNRVQGQEEQKPDTSLISEKISINNPSVLNAKYNGNEKLVLSNTTYTGSQTIVYYREKDMQRLGIDTSALSKAIEQGSEDVYIRESELAKSWKEKPVFSYAFTTLPILGEADKSKIDYITDFVEGIPTMEEVQHKQLNPDPDPYSYNFYIPSKVYAVDFISDNEVNILFRSGSKFGQYSLKIKKNMLDNWHYYESKKIIY